MMHSSNFFFLQPTHNFQVVWKGSNLYIKMKISRIVSLSFVFHIMLPDSTPSTPEIMSINYKRKGTRFTSCNSGNVCFQNYSLNVLAPNADGQTTDGCIRLRGLFLSLFSTTVQSKPCFLVFSTLFGPSRHNGE